MICLMYCKNLKYVNFGNTDCSKDEDMRSLFYKCSTLETVDNFCITFNVLKISFMLKECESLQSINLTKLFTPFLNAMDNAFVYCYSLKTIELPNFNISKIIKRIVSKNFLLIVEF